MVRPCKMEPEYGQPTATRFAAIRNPLKWTADLMDLNGQLLRAQRQQAGLSQARFSELCGVPQHQLSAFELGKLDLPESSLAKVSSALSDRAGAASLAGRTKRYREHTYVQVQRLPERVARASPTKGNSAYRETLANLGPFPQDVKGPTAISLFAGCGGFSLGFSAAGFSVKGFVELEPELRAIYKSNFPSVPELGGDITKIRASDLESYVQTLGRVDAIIGGPPCQGFSLSGKRDVDDPRNELFKHYMRFVEAFNPKVAVLENVRLLTSMKDSKGSLVKDEIAKEFDALGYAVDYFNVNASQYGVPQDRDRVIFVAVRKDLKRLPSIPPPTHFESVDMFSSGDAIRSFGDACSDLPFVESGESSDDLLHTAVKHPAHVIEWLWNVPEGQSAHDNIDPNLRPPSGYNTTYKRQVWSEPAATVQTTFGMISGCRNVHPIATRSLTIREAARLQSFPDSYRFEGNLGTIRKGIGNAVPPLLAYAIAQHIKPYI